MEIVKETHIRTTAKTVIYRISTVISVTAIAYFIFNNLNIAAGMGFMALFLGTIIYYLHDRFWLLLKWNRDLKGKDSVKRSTIKMITYRILVIIAITFTVKIITGNEVNNEQIGAFVLIQMAINLFFFFLIERIFNLTDWGKINEKIA